jgi:predicted component of type VI protein secretion system
MPAQLMALSEGPNILLDKPVLLLGRHPECDIQIDSRKISRRHCCIAQVEDYLVIRDLGSTNGIRINGVRVLEGRLRPSDELTIGNARYRVQWDAVGAEAPAKGPRVVAANDDALEDAEEPVPLEETCEPPSGLLRAAKALVAGEQPPREKPPEADSLILPDDLQLAPVSDVLPPRQPPR